MPTLDEQFEKWFGDAPFHTTSEKRLAAIAYLAGTAEEREAGKRDVAAIRLIGASQPDSSYQEGFADACDNIEHRIRQRGEGTSENDELHE